MTGLTLCRALAAAALLAGCGGGGSDTFLGLDLVEPARGPLPGGNKIVIAGFGFVHGAAAPNMVLVGGRLSSSVSVLSDKELEVVAPPGFAAATVDVIVFNGNGFDTLEGAYTYNPLPEVTAVDPAVAVAGDVVTITGSGFVDLEAGENRVLFGTARGTVESVEGDGVLTARVPPGAILSVVDVSVANQNGPGILPDGFRYTGNGLLAGRYFSPTGQLLHIDTETGEVTEVMDGFSPSFGRPFTMAVVGDSVVVNTRSNQILQRSLDGATSPIGASIPACTERRRALAEHQGTLYAWCPTNAAGERFGTLDLANRAFTPIGGDETGRYHLVSNGDDLFLVGFDNSEVLALDEASGDATPLSTHDLNNKIRGAAFDRNGTLYILRKNVNCGECGEEGFGSIHEVDPVTGNTRLITIIEAGMSGLVGVP